MTQITKMLAFDFGASSGRAILGTLQAGVLKLEEIHRFSNDPVNLNGSLHWDTLRLLHEIKQGILKCWNNGHKDIASIAIDTWGVDFGLLDEQGNLLGNPYHYRDSRTDGMMEEVFDILPMEKVYDMTGIQFMKLNTIFQLYAMKHHKTPILKEANTMLLTPDLFNYFLTGEKKAESSIASTTQLFDPIKKDWHWELIDILGLPKQIFMPIIKSGTILGNLSKNITDELGVSAIPVIATASHDTQSAIASVPSEEENFVYISCGTWSLMGVESSNALISEQTRKLAFTNEYGVGEKISFMKNIMGLWLIQECKRQWDKEGDTNSFAELETLAWKAEPFKCFINPDDEMFIAPGNMPERIRDFCKKTNQTIPADKGQIVRCIAESLALKYRQTVESLEEILGKELNSINMVGGGIKDTLLCQFTANATARKVIAGPVEATATGNLMVQAIALGKVDNIVEARKIVKASFPTKEYIAMDIQDWDTAYERFCKV